MPKPPAAFSPLTITQSSFQSLTRAGKRSVTMFRPLRPTTSPTNRMRMRSSLAAVDDLALGQDEVEPGIARRRGHARDLLRGEGEPDRGHGFCRAQTVKRHIVITGPIADAVPGAIERGERHDQHVGEDFGCVRQRLPGAPPPPRTR